MRQALRLTVLLLAGCANSSSRAPTPLPAWSPPPPREAPAGAPPAPAREFRGLWVATVQNLDWPSRPGLDAGRQQAELLAILDLAVRLHINAIVLQVRPCCDALYDSKIEPWSEFLTGKMGQAPKPYYDPLAFAVDACHQRGLELHAWFNPFRVRPRADKTPAAKNYVANTRPELVRAAGDFLMLDPSDPRSRGYSLGVIMDVVHRYDIDGVHMDDYFYPYPVAGGYQPADFPDDALWERYRKGGGKLSRGDWRRDNINTFVRLVYASIKKEKPWVKFGISPFGIWRPGHPAGVKATLDSYTDLFADSQAWLANGWVDYLSPQLYWPTDEKDRSFAALLQWWSGQNTWHRHLWPGMHTDEWPGFKVNPALESAKEIELTRRQPGATGDVLWRAGFVMRNAGVAEALARSFATPALVPASPWLGSLPAGRPVVSVRPAGRDIALSWKPAGGEPVWLWLLQEKFGNDWRTEILPGAQTSRLFAGGGVQAWPQAVAVTAVTRVGNLGPPAVTRLEPR
jgi:uncharacterized lipoprotein YddW (UPF0748 family)